MYVCVYIHVYACVCVCIYIYACIYIYMYVCVYIYVYVCVYIYVYVCVCVCIYIYMHVYIYIYMFVCNISMIQICGIDIGNLKTRNFTKLVQVRNFYSPFWVWRFFDMRRKRHTIFLCWLLWHRRLSTQPTRGARSAQSRLASLSSESQPSSSQAGTQLTDFSQIPQILNASGHDVIHISWSHFLSGIILTSLNDTSSPRARVHLRSWLHLTNPCTKRKVLS